MPIRTRALVVQFNASRSRVSRFTSSTKMPSLTFFTSAVLPRSTISRTVLNNFSGLISNHPTRHFSATPPPQGMTGRVETATPLCKREEGRKGKRPKLLQIADSAELHCGCQQS
jgi:hypothetical protein